MFLSSQKIIRHFKVKLNSEASQKKNAYQGDKWTTTTNESDQYTDATQIFQTLSWINVHDRHSQDDCEEYTGNYDLADEFCLLQIHG